MRIPLVCCAMVLVACGARAPAPVEPVSSSEAAVRAFMQAAADSNVTRMGNLWGTARGPGRPSLSQADYAKLVVVMQAYLRGDSIRVLYDRPRAGTESERDVAIQLFRGTCVKQIPVTTVRTAGGAWLVQSVDLSAAGNPARPCDRGG